MNGDAVTAVVSEKLPTSGISETTTSGSKRSAWVPAPRSSRRCRIADLAVKVKPVLLPVRSPTLFKPLHVVRRRNSEAAE
jgi:hypothetical protein